MLQRVQSIWFFLSAVMVLLLFLFPFMQFADAAGLAYARKVSGLYGQVDGQISQLESSWLLTIYTAVVGIFPIYIISQFKDRKKQIMLSLIAMLLVVMLGVWLYFMINQTLTLHQLTFSTSQLGLGVILLPIAIVFLFMGQAGVKKDEKLIRSADRLR